MSLETMTKLATSTVEVGGTASVTFSNIPQGYTDLVVKGSCRVTVAGPVDGIKISFNGSTELFTNRSVLGNGTATFSESTTSARWVGLGAATGATSSTFSNFEVYIPNYAGSTYKSFSAEAVSENNATAGYNYMFAGLWSNPTAINQITLTPDTASAINQHSTFTLYGIKNAAQTAGNSIKATGGNIVFDGTYVYHVFPSSGTFTPTQPILANVLVVAGGGAGGGQNAGGGGAGGLLEFNSQSLTAQNYTCTIGAGGTSVYQGSTTSGGNSQFGSLTASVGGGAGGFFWGGGAGDGQLGGSGGGAQGVGGSLKTGGAGTAGQGNNGGNNLVNSYAGAGGGGAGAAGSTVVTNEVGAAGGIGATSALINSIGLNTGAGQLSGGNYYFAGGGGGGGDTTNGAGGLGGGGAAGATVPTAGRANTGGGGGGARGAAAGGAGGSGIIVVRYKG
jgi:hypothetical protein